MKKTALLLASGLFTLPAALAQHLSPSVVASGGGHAQTATMTLEWTLGESSVRSLTASRRLYTEGFHQPPVRVERLSEQRQSAEAIEVVASPNPTSADLNVRVTAPADSDVLVDLTDLGGRPLLSRPARANQPGIRLNLLELPAGMYLLQIRGSDGAPTRTHKILKQ